MAEKKLTKAQIVAREHAEMGKCRAMVDGAKRNSEPHECTRWATSLVGGKGYCTQHAGGFLEDELAAKQAEFRKADLDRRIDAFIAKRQHEYELAAIR